MLHTDTYGEEHDVTARMDVNTGERTVAYDLDHYTPAQARVLAADILAAAAHLERRLLPVPVEPRCANCNEIWGIRESGGAECLNCGLGVVGASLP